MSFLTHCKSLYRGSFLIVLFGLCLTAAVWLGILHHSSIELSDEIQDVTDLNDGMARAFEEHVRLVLKTADNALLFLKLEYEDNDGVTKGMIDFVDASRKDPLHNHIALADMRGDLLLSSVSSTLYDNGTIRELFRASAMSQNGIYISKPFFSQASGTWSFFINRRLKRRDGASDGIVFAELDPSYFLDFYRAADLGKARSISLVGKDGIVRARLFRGKSEVGMDIPSSPLFDAVRRRGVGHYEALSVVDGMPKLSSYRAMQDYPLIVLLTSLRSAALESFEKRRQKYYLSALIFSAFVAGFCFLLIRADIRTRRQNERLAGELNERRKAEEALLRSKRDLSVKNRINDIFLAHADDEMFGEVLKSILDFMRSEYGIFGYFGENGSFVAPAVTRMAFWEACNVPEKEVIFTQGLFCDLWRRAFTEKTTLVYNRGPFKTPQGHIPIHNAMVTPIIFRNELISVIHIANNPHGYTEEDRALLDDIANQIAPVLHARIQKKRQDEWRGKIEAVLMESEKRYRELFGAITDALLVHEAPLGRFIEVNDVACQRLGYSREELLAMSPVDIDAHDSETDLSSVIQQLAAGKTAIFEQVHIARDGSRIPVEITSRTFEFQGHPVIMSMARDITDRKEKEEDISHYQGKLQRLMFESTVLEERERKRIADELHDTIGQNLVFSKLRLSSLRELELPDGGRKTVDEIIDIMNQTIQFSRSLTYELASPVLYMVGFDAGMRWLAEQIEKNQGIPVKVKIQGDLSDIKGEMKVLLYKTVRELLFNMVKHAQAGHVMINIRKLTGTVEIDVIDDGVGFSRPYAPSYGLFSVAERIKYLGGTMETGTNTETGKGARVSITVPLTQKNKGGARV